MSVSLRVNDVDGERAARSAFRITTTSIASWTRAPHTAGSRPNAAAIIPAIDIAIPATTLWTAMRRVRRASTCASPSRSRRSTVSTMSAASEDAVAPRAPMAIPTSASANAGASLMPSPTIIVGANSLSARTTSSLSAGERSASVSSTPMTAPIVSATSARSPVTITIRRMPLLRSDRTVRLASARIGSSKIRTPAGSPSTATKTVRDPSSRDRRRAAFAHAGAPTIPTQSAFPDATR